MARLRRSRRSDPSEFRKLGWHRLYDVEVAWNRNYLAETEPGASEQITVFLHRAHLAASQDQHCDVGQLSSGTKIAFR